MIIATATVAVTVRLDPNVRATFTTIPRTLSMQNTSRGIDSPYLFAHSFSRFSVLAKRAAGKVVIQLRCRRLVRRRKGQTIQISEHVWHGMLLYFFAHGATNYGKINTFGGDHAVTAWIKKVAAPQCNAIHALRLIVRRQSQPTDCTNTGLFHSAHY